MKKRLMILMVTMVANSLAYGYLVTDYTWITNPSNGHQYAITQLRYYGIQDETANIYQPDLFDAENEAQAIGGHLVTIRNDAENSWLAQMFNTNEYWIGLTDWGSEGTWHWLSGEPVTYTNWDGSQPDNAHAGEDAATLNHMLNGQPFGLPGIWNDLGNVGYGIDIPYPDNHTNLPTYGIIEIPEPATLLLLAFGGLLLRRK
jgi:hypothetical protein